MCERLAQDHGVIAEDRTGYLWGTELQCNEYEVGIAIYKYYL